ncbi:MAG: hypothetical protein IIA45_06370 [Bacteroidetes bacterium]|nr:hypothetical protein [Bacteroidota bacterium]
MEKHRHSCSELIKRVYLCLDGEMSPQQEEDFLEELGCCNSCLEKYDIEKNFKQYLIEKVQRRKISVVLVNNIRQQIKDSFRMSD